MNKQIPLDKKIEKLKKGCGKIAIWNVQEYKCGSFEDLKHSDHIILCDNCRTKLSAYEDAQKIFREAVKELKENLLDIYIQGLRNWVMRNSHKGYVTEKGLQDFITNRLRKSLIEDINKIFGKLAEENLKNDNHL